ncbi:hypothetical protein CLF_110685, partial [Clonorchis sinensis]
MGSVIRVLNFRFRSSGSIEGALRSYQSKLNEHRERQTRENSSPSRFPQKSRWITYTSYRFQCEAINPMLQNHGGKNVAATITATSRVSYCTSSEKLKKGRFSGLYHRKRENSNTLVTGTYYYYELNIVFMQTSVTFAVKGDITGYPNEGTQNHCWTLETVSLIQNLSEAEGVIDASSCETEHNLVYADLLLCVRRNSIQMPVYRSQLGAATAEMPTPHKIGEKFCSLPGVESIQYSLTPDTAAHSRCVLDTIGLWKSIQAQAQLKQLIGCFESRGPYQNIRLLHTRPSCSANMGTNGRSWLDSLVGTFPLFRHKNMINYDERNLKYRVRKVCPRLLLSLNRDFRKDKCRVPAKFYRKRHNSTWRHSKHDARMGKQNDRVANTRVFDTETEKTGTGHGKYRKTGQGHSGGVYQQATPPCPAPVVTRPRTALQSDQHAKATALGRVLRRRVERDLCGWSYLPKRKPYSVVRCNGPVSNDATDETNPTGSGQSTWYKLYAFLITDGMGTVRLTQGCTNYRWNKQGELKRHPHKRRMAVIPANSSCPPPDKPTLRMLLAYHRSGLTYGLSEGCPRYVARFWPNEVGDLNSDSDGPLFPLSRDR